MEALTPLMVQSPCYAARERDTQLTRAPKIPDALSRAKSQTLTPLSRSLAALSATKTTNQTKQTTNTHKQPGNGSSIKASPKKGGDGGHNWGSWRTDDVDI
jgi:hypothetical protein